MEGIKVAKKKLRSLISNRMLKLSAENLRNQSLIISQSLRQLPEYQKAKNIAVYMHMDEGEVQTTHIIRNAFADKKRVFLPKIVPLPQHLQRIKFKSHLKELYMLEVENMDAVNSLQPHGNYQLREPETGTNAFDAGGLDLIVVPGVGFSRSCERIGHGKGFYDSFFNQHIEWSHKHKKCIPFLVAIGANEQLVEAIPREEHDHILDAAIIADRVYRKNV
ncbi:nagb/rpia/CoA transferase-like protein [Nadsonia fulvescens var. elongata DSM 6958]|uniref:5-formyltetrahydrofolate cyclo-ligase n=1 Tax=Nadsonia fulvescens var. elongata DSM 6958 TaxID=857566 RepID=A0A1E3PSA0_9ASCO|nr:nagb/rpia/CoA transferase-like protein [Nadsonia fulvescens var. elongata DSM 6958]